MLSVALDLHQIVNAILYVVMTVGYLELNEAYDHLNELLDAEGAN